MKSSTAAWTSDAARHLGKSGDGGVDGVIAQDRLGLDNIYVQAKRLQAGDNVGRDRVQAFVGSLVGRTATKGVFFATSDFSPQARDYATGVNHNIVLVNGEELVRLMYKHGVGVRVKETYEVKSVYYAWMCGRDFGDWREEIRMPLIQLKGIEAE